MGKRRSDLTTHPDGQPATKKFVFGSFVYFSTTTLENLSKSFKNSKTITQKLEK